MENPKVAQQGQVGQALLRISNSLSNLINRVGEIEKKSEVCEDVSKLRKTLEDLQQRHLGTRELTEENYTEINNLVHDALSMSITVLCALPIPLVHDFVDDVRSIQNVSLEYSYARFGPLANASRLD